MRRRPDNAVDTWDGRTYRRALEGAAGTIKLAAVQAGSSVAPRLRVTLTGTRLDRRTEEAARVALARLLGPKTDLSSFYRLAEGDPLLRTLAARFRGLKPARFPTLFECLVNAIACQQLTPSWSASACRGVWIAAPLRRDGLSTRWCLPPRQASLRSSEIGGGFDD